MTRLLIFACITLPALLLVLLALLLGSRAGADWLLREIGARSGLYTLEAVESGDLLGPLELRGLLYEDEQVRVEIDHLRFNWAPLALVARRAYITELQVGTARVTLKEAPPQDPAPARAPPVSLPLALRLERIGAQAVHITPSGGETLSLLDLAFAGDWTGNRVRIQTARVRVPDLGTLDAQGEASLTGKGMRLHALRLAQPFPVQASGWLRYREDSELELTWQDARWPLQGAAVVSSREGRLHARGQPAAYALELAAVHFDAGAVQGQLDGGGRGDTGQFTFDALGARLLDGQLDLSGHVSWQGGLDLDLRADARGLDPGRLDAAWPGRINGRAQLRGRWSGQAPDLEFSARLQHARLRGYPLQLEGRGHWRGATLQLQHLRLASSASQLELGGQVLPVLALDARLRSPDLRQLYPGLQGRAELDARLRGALRNPRVQLDGTAQQLVYGEARVQTLRLLADAGLERVSHIGLEAQQVQLGAAFERVQLTLDGRADGHRLSLSASGVAGQLQAAVDGGWDRRRARWQGQISQIELVPATLAPWSLQAPAPLQASATHWRLAPLCLASRGGGLCVEGARAGAGSRLAFRLEQLDFAYLDPALPPGWSLSGGVDGRGELHYGVRGLGSAEAALTVTPGRLRTDSGQELIFLAGELGAQNTARGLHFYARQPLQGGQLALEADVAAGARPLMERALRGTLRLEVPQLDWLGALSPELVAVQGRLDAALRLAGTGARPRLEGELTLAASRAQLRTPGITLAPFNLRLQGDGSERIRLEADARSGDGSLQLDGDVLLGAQPPDLRLRLSGDNFQAANRPDVRAWISPDLKLDVRGQRADLSGEVYVPRAQITPRNIDSGVAPSSDQVIVRDDTVATPQGAIALHSDVRLRLGEAVSFKGFGLTTRFTGSVNAQGAPGRPAAGRGEIRLVDGRYKAYGQDLQIEAGRLLFTGGPLTDPAVEIRAIRQPREDITVGVLVRGRLDAPEFSLFSSPAMPQERQLSWLVLGRSLEEGGSQDERALLTGAALSMGLSSSNVLAQRVRGGLRLDDISIGSRPGEDAEQARLTVGKYLSPDLYVSYGVGLFQPGHVFRLLYTIGRGFKLQTESGVESGGDLIYSIER